MRRAEDAAGAVADGPGQPMVELAANIDDATGEVLAHTVGAPGGWSQRRVGHPDRHEEGAAGPHVARALRPRGGGDVAPVLVASRAPWGCGRPPCSAGPRAATRSRSTSPAIGCEKRAGHRMKAEHDDAVAAAEALGRPLRAVLAEAEHLASVRAARSTGGLEPLIGPRTSHPW